MTKDDGGSPQPAAEAQAASRSREREPSVREEERRSGGGSGGHRRGRARSVAVEATEEALKERNDQYLRLAADFDNYRRRSQQELVDRSRYASEDAARALLPVLDNLRRAVEHVPSDGADSRLLDGLNLVVREFESALERLGVVPIDAVGAAFDPSLHEAVGGEESDDVDTETVVHELQRGYRLHDRVLRPAMVRIAHPRAV